MSSPSLTFAHQPTEILFTCLQSISGTLPLIQFTLRPPLVSSRAACLGIYSILKGNYLDTTISLGLCTGLGRCGAISCVSRRCSFAVAPTCRLFVCVIMFILLFILFICLFKYLYSIVSLLFLRAIYFYFLYLYVILYIFIFLYCILFLIFLFFCNVLSWP